jgi:hypothetical protein
MLPICFEPVNLPHPPAILVNSLMNHWVQKYKSLTKVQDYPDLKMELALPCDNEEVKRISTFDPIVHPRISAWLKNNIMSTNRPYSNWILRVLHLYSSAFEPGQQIEIYEKHLDSIYKDPTWDPNTYVLIYNVSDSDGDLVFYQEDGHPIIRKDRPVYMPPTGGQHQLPHETLTFGPCHEIGRFMPVVNSWYVSRIDVVHSVENANLSPRIALQLRLTEQEAEQLYAK